MHSAKAMADGRGRSRLLLACISTKFRGTKAEFCMCRVMTDSHVRLVVHNKSRNRKSRKVEDWQAAKYEAKGPQRISKLWAKSFSFNGIGWRITTRGEYC